MRRLVSMTKYQTGITYVQLNREGEEPTATVSTPRCLCFDMDMSYTRVLHIKVAYRVPHK
jgi:hypothetical protein